MNFKSIVSFIAGLVILQSCSTSKNDVLWVGGIKTECDAGAGKTECLKVFKGEDLKDEKWQDFYSHIEGFEYEEGYMKKIEVMKKDVDNKEVPADASSIKYTLVKELDKKEDPRVHLKDNWVLASMNGGPLNKMVVLPTLNFDLNEMRISGNGGCNLYSAEIEGLTSKKIQIKQGLATLKACINENIEDEYNKILSETEAYKVKDEVLSFYDKSGKEILSFIKVNTSKLNTELVVEWKNIRIDEEEINAESTPEMVFDLKEMRVGGVDGCNSFNATIESISNTDLLLGPIASTKMMCHEMEVPKLFLDAMHHVVAYKIENGELILLDNQGKEKLAFVK